MLVQSNERTGSRVEKTPSIPFWKVCRRAYSYERKRISAIIVAQDLGVALTNLFCCLRAPIACVPARGAFKCVPQNPQQARGGGIARLRRLRPCLISELFISIHTHQYRRDPHRWPELRAKGLSDDNEWPQYQRDIMKNARMAPRICRPPHHTQVQSGKGLSDCPKSWLKNSRELPTVYASSSLHGTVEKTQSGVPAEQLSNMGAFIDVGAICYGPLPA